jgi:CDP-diacylglycerol--glycerol-3-phosphate 3-phosphatidyltransferase
VILNVPNLVTLSRIILIPLLIGIYYTPDGFLSREAQNIIATSVFILAGITDWLDGYLARRLNQMSAFGAFLDPVADKLIVVAALVVLLHLEPPRVHAFVALIIIGREIAISALREWMAEIGKRGKVKVSKLAKLKTILQIVGLSCMLFRWNLPVLPGISLPVFEIGFVLTIIAAALTLISAVSYLRAAWPDLRGHA